MPKFPSFGYAAFVAALTPASAVLTSAGAAEPEAVLTQALADTMAQRCLSESKNKGWPAFSIAIVDGGGALILLRRQDAAAPVTAEVAALKAKSAVRTGAATQALSTMSQDPPTRDLFLLLQLTADPGGVPVKINGRTVGAIGVSGGTAEQDIGCATAASGALLPEKK
ncbi:MAG: heme-binding protein [Proteobacteria bacterium]|nr:heme-binding protein [Pseudomonadota bacterium]